MPIVKTFTVTITCPPEHAAWDRLDDEETNLENVILDGLGFPDTVTVKATLLRIETEANHETPIRRDPDRT